MRTSKPTILPRIQRPTNGNPYTYAYESLNGKTRGLWPWRRWIAGGTLLIVLAWISLGFSGYLSDEPVSQELDFEFPIPHPSSPAPHRPPPSAPKPASNPPPSTKPRPALDFDHDSNPASTNQCELPYRAPNAPIKPLVQWALMIDAGSTGSRIHIYKFNNCGPQLGFEYEVFKQTRPGLSTYANDPQAAAESLDALMKEAARVVPQSLADCTPVAVKATAGLRLLGQAEADAILHAVEMRLKTVYHFQLVQTGGVEIMDGKDEGVHAWVTANYLLGTLPSTTAHSNPDSTEGHAIPYAVLDLGGASTQIVFKPSYDLDGDGIESEEEINRVLEEGEHKYSLKFGGGRHVLYQHSYLGYGLMRARARVHSVVEFMSHFAPPRASSHRIGDDEYPELDEEEEVYNPCIVQGMTRKVKVEVGKGGEEKKNVTMSGGDVGSWDGCNRVLELVLAKDAVCQLKPCSFNGVYQPSLLDTFPSGPILLLSYFYDRLAPLLTPALPPSKSSKSVDDPTDEISFPISLIKDIATSVCAGESTWKITPFPYPSPSFSKDKNKGTSSLPMKWGDDEGLMEELRGRPEWCLDLSFMYALLRLGYEFGEERTVRVGKKVAGTELGWCLGATLGMLGSADWTCRA